MQSLRLVPASHAFIREEVQSVLQEIVPARIVQITSETPTVKRFRLKVDADFAFCPGQWVDFFVPGLRQVGGYSICSSQKQLRDSRTFDLAVKQSAHAPALWLHHQASIGAAVSVRVGGCFCLEQRHLKHPLLFLAGGIGITPIAAMVSHAVCNLKSGASQGHRAPRAALLYSIRSRKEAALLEDLQQLAAAGRGCFHLDVRITDGLDRRQRLSMVDLQKVLGLLSEGKEVGANEAPMTFVSGPKSFEHDMIQYLRDLRLPANHILCEQWQ